MSNFIFNGICSDDMGLIIEKLPPIVKPPKRYNLIEIDGADRAVVETLGYKAYEKTIPVGFKNTDLSEIVDWLEGEGKLILSNEEDKYYDAFILNQIDYERIIRYRKANIIFLVQPYKYSIGEEETTAREVINQGNVDCLPLMTIYGSGYIVVSINNVEVCRISNINGYISLDGEEQEAKKGDVLQNRIMSGQFPVFSPGLNKISFTGSGTVTEVKTIVRSRWL